MTASDDREITPPDMPPRAESATLGLKPISLDLEPAVQQFVTELRRVFSKLEISLGEYSRRNYRDKSVLSRYLSGNRIPSRELLDELIDEISRTRSIPLSAEAENRLHKFHLEALASRDRRAYQIQVLTDLLENATTELWQAKQQIKELEGQLSQRDIALANQTAGIRQQPTRDTDQELTSDDLPDIRRPIPARARMVSQSGRELPAQTTLRRWDPEMIGPYAVLGRLGAGSMGQVYLGKSAAGRLVAVKTIKVELAEETGFRTRFAQEVAAARKVSGVFTAAVVEADPDADLPWLATAYVPAPSLSRMIQVCGPMPVRMVRWLAAGCAEALESIHGAGLVHRDLKPSNVLVAPDGPRVIDFGVARAAERMVLTGSQGAVGTPAYMAPEQARDPHQASVASDVYSLGATLLFAATGHPPYLGASVLDVLARLATEEPDLSGLPAELTPLVTACMARVPRDRPTSSAVLAQLGQFTEARASAAYGFGPAHAYLPEPAMALIGEYQRSPQVTAFRETSEDSDYDVTVLSYPGLPTSGVQRNTERNFWNRISAAFRSPGSK